MRYPEFLQQNGTIAFVAPSFGCATEPYRSGFLLATLCDTASVYGPCASSFGMEPWHRSLEDAMALLQGKKLTMTGYDMWERESLKDEEHPYAPYNLTETTVIKYIMPDGRTNIESLSGRAQSTAMSESQPGNIQSTGVCAGQPEHVRGAADIEISFSGRLLGGCVDCMINMLGTKYDRVTEYTERYKEDGILWFLEACDLNLMSIRRAMWQMEHAGWFRHCSGFLIGRPRMGMGVEEFGIDHYQAAYEMLRKYNVPVVMDVDIGHLSPMMPIICGSIGRVVSDGREYRVEMELR